MTARSETAARRAAGTCVALLRALRAAVCDDPRALAELTLAADELAAAAASPLRATAMPLADHLEARERTRAARAGRVQGLMAGTDPDRLAARADEAIDACERALGGAGCGTVGTEEGPVRLVDVVRALTIEARLLADRCGVVPDRAGAAQALRACSQVLGERFGGLSIELRVPPTTAVQLRAPDGGPVHHRGTPPNVVETDPDTFWALCTGALTWERAHEEHLLRVSGVHAAEVARMLPVVSPR